MANIFPFALYSGDPIPVTLVFYDATQTPSPILDITGTTVGLTVKTNATDPDSDAIYQKDTAGDSTGIVKFSIPSPDPGNYVLDVKWWDFSNVRNNILQDAFTVNQSVTARTLPGAVPGPVPVLSSVSPNTIANGSATFTLTVAGSAFQTNAVIVWGGIDHATAYVSSIQLTCQITTNEILTAKTVPVTVRNGDGQVSGSLNFTVT